MWEKESDRYVRFCTVFLLLLPPRWSLLIVVDFWSIELLIRYSLFLSLFLLYFSFLLLSSSGRFVGTSFAFALLLLPFTTFCTYIISGRMVDYRSGSPFLYSDVHVTVLFIFLFAWTSILPFFSVNSSFELFCRIFWLLYFTFEYIYILLYIFSSFEHLLNMYIFRRAWHLRCVLLFLRSRPRVGGKRRWVPVHLPVQAEWSVRSLPFASASFIELERTRKYLCQRASCWKIVMWCWWMIGINRGMIPYMASSWHIFLIKEEDKEIMTMTMKNGMAWRTFLYSDLFVQIFLYIIYAISGQVMMFLHGGGMAAGGWPAGDLMLCGTSVAYRRPFMVYRSSPVAVFVHVTDLVDDGM